MWTPEITPDDWQELQKECPLFTRRVEVGNRLQAIAKLRERRKHFLPSSSGEKLCDRFIGDHHTALKKIAYMVLRGAVEHLATDVQRPQGYWAATGVLNRAMTEVYYSTVDL